MSFNENDTKEGNYDQGLSDGLEEYYKYQQRVKDVLYQRLMIDDKWNYWEIMKELGIDDKEEL